MNIFKLTLANIIRYLKTPSLMLSMFLFPIVMVIGLNVFLGKSDDSSYLGPIALACNIDGKYEKELINNLDLQDNVYSFNERESALELLQNNEVSSVFILNQDFSDNIENLTKPSIEYFKTTTGVGNMWAESQIENFINESLKNKIDPTINSNLVETKIVNIESSIPMEFFGSVFMTCYLMYINSGSLSKDLIDLRKNNLLKRMISTPNTDINLLLSLLLSIFLVQCFAYILSFICLSLLTDTDITFNALVLIITNSFVSTSLVLFFTRICKNEGVLSIAMVLYPIISLGLAFPLILPSMRFDITILNNLSLLSPFYWTINAFKSDSLLINIIPLILMGVVYITAGSIRLRDFAKN